MHQPVVAGAFYPGDKRGLEGNVREFLQRAKEKVKGRDAIGGICPHAGYIYSGGTAAYSFWSMANLKKKNVTVVFIGPNHTGFGSAVAISKDRWMTPLGEVSSDVELADAVKEYSSIATFDEIGHRAEHSIEVQLPFLQVINPDAKIVAICMMAQDTDSAVDVGKAIAKASRKAKGKEILVIASSDFTHYESAESARKKDSEALELIKKLQYEEFESLVMRKGLSICGHGPIAALLCYAREMGAKKADLLRYTNSGETSGDFFQVVGYASVVVDKP